MAYTKPPFTETKLKSRLFNILTNHYPNAYFRKASDRFRAGILDCFLCNRGRAIWVELKIYPSVVTPLQDREIESIRKAGGNAVVLSCDKAGERFWLGSREYSDLKTLVAELIREV